MARDLNRTSGSIADRDFRLQARTSRSARRIGGELGVWNPRGRHLVSSDSSNIATISVSRSRARLMRAGGIVSLALAMVTACATLALAQDSRNTTRADIDRWLAKYGDTKPDFKPGDVLTVKDFERIRPFMMPGYVEQFNFPQMRMELIATRNHTPHKEYM